jgi:uncharacterized membrane protein YciS (DUF1049 family)
MQRQINIELHSLSGQNVKELLEAQSSWNDSSIQLEIRGSNRRYRGITDPTMLVAIVGVAGSAIGALLTGLLQIAQQNALKKIVLRYKKVETQEIPVDTQLKEI